MSDISTPAETIDAANLYSPDDSVFHAQRAGETSNLIDEVLRANGVEGYADEDVAETEADGTGDGTPEGVDAAEPDVLEVAAAPKQPVADDDVRGTLRVLEAENALRKEREAFKAELDAFRRERDADRASNVTRMSVEEIKAAIRRDPIKFFSETVGEAPEQVSRRIIAAKLGDKAPAELRETAREYEYNERFEALERKLLEKDYALERERVRNGTQEFLGKQDLGSSKYPTLAAVAAVDRTRVTEAIFAEIAQDAQEKAKTDRNAPLLGYDEAAQRVEDNWAVYRKALVPGTDVTATPANVPPVAKPVGTKPTPPVKRPAPPRKPYWLQDDTSEVEAALEAATAIARKRA